MCRFEKWDFLSKKKKSQKDVLTFIHVKKNLSCTLKL